MRRVISLSVFVTLGLVLAACDQTGSFFGPQGTLVVEFSPPEAEVNTWVFSANYQKVGEYDGDFRVGVPAGTYRISSTAPGFDSYYATVTVAGGEELSVEVELLPELHATFSSFNVTRYETAVGWVYGLTTNQDIGSFTLKLRCVEDGYPNLTTYLRGGVSLAAGETKTVVVQYSSGFSYFTSNTVRCSFSGETSGGREVHVSRR